MVGFTELPREVVHNICSHLQNDIAESRANKVGLYGLLRASKKCNEIATPYLYHSLYPAHVSAGVLALTLHRRPTLAALVHLVDLDGCLPIRGPTDQAARRTFLEELGESTALPNDPPTEIAEDDLPIDDEDRINQTFQRRFTEAVFTRLPQLEVLALTLTEELIDFDSTTIRYSCQNNIQHPQELTIRHYDTEGGFEMSSIMPFLAGNSITKVNLFACAGFGEATQINSSVKALHLDRSALELDEFDSLVHCFPNLEILVLETADPSVTQYLDDTPSAFKISIDLQPLKDTLRSLTLDQRERLDLEEDSDSGPYNKKPISSLRVFYKLEELVIWQFDLTRSRKDESAANLDDSQGDDASDRGEGDEGEDEGEDDQLMPWIDKLPSSLRILKIIGATEAIEPGLWQLSEIASEEYPALKEVASCRRVKGLQSVFQRAGIKYSIDQKLA